MTRSKSSGKLAAAESRGRAAHLPLPSLAKPHSSGQNEEPQSQTTCSRGLPGESVDQMLTSLDKKFRTNDCVTLQDLHSEHTCLREYTKLLSAHLSKLLESSQRKAALASRRYVEPKGTAEREVMLVRAKIKNNGSRA